MYLLILVFAGYRRDRRGLFPADTGRDVLLSPLSARRYDPQISVEKIDQDHQDHRGSHLRAGTFGVNILLDGRHMNKIRVAVNTRSTALL